MRAVYKLLNLMPVLCARAFFLFIICKLFTIIAYYVK